MLRGLLAGVAAASLTAACGNADVAPEAQPATDGANFVQGTFDELPRHPRSAPAGERSQKRDVVAQSFKVNGATPEAVMEFFQRALDGWTMVGEVEKIGVNSFRGHWKRDRLRLTVTATGGPTLSEEGEVASQYSLSLRTQ